MEYFLERIDGLSSENLTTELLGFILDSPLYSPYQCLFYSLLFPNNKLKDTDSRQYAVQTQLSFESAGRPDIVLEGENQVIYIENKFYASFSKDDQMYRYYDHLKNNYYGKEKLLVLLTIKDRIEPYLREIKSQFTKVLDGSKLQDVFTHCKDNGVQLIVISWDEIFQLFGTKDLLIANLTHYIKSKYIASTILNEGELQMLNTRDVPILLDKLWAGVDKIKDILSSENYSVRNTTQSRHFYGFVVERPWGTVWIGYYFQSWLNYDTPYVMQIRSEWINENYKTSEFDTQMRNTGFILDKNLEFLYPLIVKETDLVGNVIETIKAKLDQLDLLFVQKGIGD